VDGLKGFPDAVEAVFPQTNVQLCIVHMERHSLNFVGWKERKHVANAPSRAGGDSPLSLKMALMPPSKRRFLVLMSELIASGNFEFQPQSYRYNSAG